MPKQLRLHLDVKKTTDVNNPSHSSSLSCTDYIGMNHRLSIPPAPSLVLSAMCEDRFS